MNFKNIRLAGDSRYDGLVHGSGGDVKKGVKGWASAGLSALKNGQLGLACQVFNRSGRRYDMID